MKIEASMVNLGSTRDYVKYVNKKQESIVTKGEEAAAIFEMSLADSEKDLVTNIQDYQKDKEVKQNEMREKALYNHMANMMNSKKVEKDYLDEIKTPEDLELQCLKKILEGMAKYFNKRYGKKCVQDKSDKPSFDNCVNKASLARGNSNLFGLSNSFSVSSSFSMMSATSIMGVSSTGGEGMVSGIASGAWVRSTATSAFMTEVEHTTFSSTGMVKTSDGREISFGVSIEMSRAFCARYDSLVQEEVIFTDPLIINADSSFAKVEDKKFLFDLNCDGTEEEVSFAGEGSGFLALDKNGDGKINDGSELFGTKSGNGFKDLAMYDTDRNGWIDENDDVFADLRVWTKGEGGEDKLISLLESDVGAIYLGYADTEFTLNNNENSGVNGVVRSTGVFLKESGGVGTISHVDLAL